MDWLIKSFKSTLSNKIYGTMSYTSISWRPTGNTGMEDVVDSDWEIELAPPANQFNIHKETKQNKKKYRNDPIISVA